MAAHLKQNSGALWSDFPELVMFLMMGKLPIIGNTCSKTAHAHSKKGKLRQIIFKKSSQHPKDHKGSLLPGQFALCDILREVLLFLLSIKVSYIKLYLKYFFKVHNSIPLEKRDKWFCPAKEKRDIQCISNGRVTLILCRGDSVLVWLLFLCMAGLHWYYFLYLNWIIW